MVSTVFRPFLLLLVSSSLLVSCTSSAVPSTAASLPTLVPTTEPAVATATETTVPPTTLAATTQDGFLAADGTRPLTFPDDFGSHSDFRTEWWYYTGNLQTQEGRHFGFELTIFRVGLLPPTAELPSNSAWSAREVYFAHFAVSDIESDQFHAFQRYSRPGPGLAGAEADPYRVWLEDWNITQTTSGVYRLQAQQSGVALDLTLTDEMGVVLHGDQGYSRKGADITNASYYYSQPRLRADGTVIVNNESFDVAGLTWKDHEFSTSVLDENQIGWDWFSLQFEDGRALMLFQLRERDGGISESASGTFINGDGTPQPMQKSGFQITVLDQWQSPHTGGMYPSAWDIQINQPNCTLNAEPWMSDQEINFPPITYWEGAVKFEGTCDGDPVRGNGYIELTGYAGNLPLP